MMTTDKVLVLAKEAGLAVTISSHDSLYKFAALLQQQMEADGWRQCAVGQGTTQFCGVAEELRKDAERYRWQMENPAIAFHYYKVRGFTTEYSAEIDRARSANE